MLKVIEVVVRVGGEEKGVERRFQFLEKQTERRHQDARFGRISEQQIASTAADSAARIEHMYEEPLQEGLPNVKAGTAGAGGKINTKKQIHTAPLGPQVVKAVCIDR